MITKKGTESEMWWDKSKNVYNGAEGIDQIKNLVAERYEYLSQYLHPL